MPFIGGRARVSNRFRRSVALAACAALVGSAPALGSAAPLMRRPVAPSGSAAAMTENVLFAFTGKSTGTTPYASLVADGSGNLYGTTSGGGALEAGTVYRLTPPSPGQHAWTQTVLHSFSGTGGDGSDPQASLLIFKGALYGVTTSGGDLTCAGGFGCGVAFRLDPPATGRSAWIETIVHTFEGTDGASPQAALVADGAGNLYGTTSAGGAFRAGSVFVLSPPAIAGGAWPERVLHVFSGGADGSSPQSPLLRDSSTGNLFGTTPAGGVSNYGVVFELSPGVRGWTENIVHAFSGQDGAFPRAGLTAAHGRLFGTTASGGPSSACIAAASSDCGTVFELDAPLTPTSPWPYTLLHAFTGIAGDGAGPNAGVIADRGALYGTTLSGGAGGFGYGTVFRLAPPQGGGAWTESVVHAFGGNGDGQFPFAALVADPAGHLYGTTSGGGGNMNGGAAFELF